jgi:tRNA-uridine 2-sulfurtransferase
MIIVGMSGGVDSAIAAYLLKQQGFVVQGLFMKNWEEDDTENYCNASLDLQDAQAVCDKLNLPLHTANFASDYWEQVFANFLAEYRAGRTPNPDILCNREIKFKVFLHHAQRLGAEAIATGHYVRRCYTGHDWQLQRGLDGNKDQSYFLYTLGQEQLALSHFPLGELHKGQVRDLAQQLNLTVHAKKDSTGICFIGERKFKDFLQRFIPAQPGDIISVDGMVIGQHSGVMYYTLGQRKGLNIGGMQHSSGEAWYVVGKNIEQNQLIVAQGWQHPALFTHKLRASQLSWVSGIAPKLGDNYTAKTRYRQNDQSCNLEYINDDYMEISFVQAQRAVTPGQSVVIYQQNTCLGGGIIDSCY